MAEAGVVSQPDLVVTGAAGFLGRGVLHVAADAGYLTTAVIRACESLVGADAARAVVLDWGDERALLRLLADSAPAAIIHCAGASGRASSASGRDDLYEANVGVTIRLLEAVRRQCPRVRVVVLSSAAVYGPSPPVPTGEDVPPAPETEYAASKLRAEEVARSYADGGGEVVIARPFNIVGAGEPPGSVFAALATQVLGVPRGAQAHVRLRETSSVRDFLDVEDCARALVKLSVAGVSGRAYNVCSGRGVSIGDLVVSAARVWGRRIELELDDPDAPGTVSIGDPAALRALGWRVERSLDDSLAAIAAQGAGQAP
jgi:nucleoside-diphosphate-sugar epimerase